MQRPVLRRLDDFRARAGAPAGRFFIGNLPVAAAFCNVELWNGKPSPLVFRVGAPGQRSQTVSMDDFYTLFTFARRSAVFALRDNQSSHIIDGLTAIAVIELKRADFRDALVPLALLYNAAIRIGDNPDTLIRSAVALAESNMSALMEEFINRSPNDKDLRQWGHLVMETENGPGLVKSR